MSGVVGKQKEAPRFEVIVPYDESVAAVKQLSSRYPDVRFVLVEGLDTAHARAGASREHHDIPRRYGLSTACASAIALTEDHAVVDQSWCRSLFDALREHPAAAAVGGAVETHGKQLLNWAVYFCDFGRYQNPLPECQTRVLSDCNVVYRREALNRIRETWSAAYREPLVHDALAAEGFQLIFSPRPQVWQQRGLLSLRGVVRERYVWGRSYATSRVRSSSLLRRLGYTLVTPALPFLLTWRCARTVLDRGRLRSRFVIASPLVLLLHTVWAVGEFMGYATGSSG